MYGMKLPEDQGGLVRKTAILVFVFMLVLAAVPGIHSTQDLDWGPTVDFYRDGAYVHGLLEGRYGEDPQYKGEHLWYTPLLFVVEAALVKVTGLPVEAVLVRAGAWLDLLAPICFFIMAWYFRGPVTAVAASAIYLFFLVGEEPGWAVPTYSPWLIPVSFVQAFFYLDLILIDRAFRSDRGMPSLLMGTAVGVTFLSHAVPALIAVAIIAALTIGLGVRHWRMGERSRAIRRVILGMGSGLVFLITSLPLLWYIVGDYGLHMENRAPFLYTYYVLTLRNMDLLLMHNLTWVSLAGLAGAVVLVREVVRRRQLERVIELAWFGICIFLFCYAYIVSAAEDKYGIRLPGTAPTFHYFFYMKAALVLFAGGVVSDPLHRSITWLNSRFRGTDGAPGGRAGIWAMAIWALPITVIYPAYAHRADLFIMRSRSLVISEDHDRTDMFIHVRQLLGWDHVVLCDDELSMLPMMPSARKVLVTLSTMANPYVAHNERVLDRNALFEGLHGNDPRTEELLSKYGVTHLLLSTEQEQDLSQRATWFPTEVYRNERYVLFTR